MFEINLDDQELKHGLGQLLKNAANSRPMMRAIATEMVSMTEENFERESWGDKKWDDSARSLSELLDSKRKQKGKTLQLSGQLAASISTKVGNSFARIGSNKPYAAIHHLGGQTKAHEIRPRNKKSLAFVKGGDNVNVKSVRHPGSKIPERAFLPIDGKGSLQSGAEQRLLDIALEALKKGI
ncbi:phage virion morphogenesis protein [Neisseria weaveri]|uniref:phage virion morphogenesis protein n=1 Tax=Neisseria weaveri TaxID=28091 RepID=UPI0007C9A26B|nr:phage virion morphogenesis protein [Neisseria weaveri]SAY50907.1 phage-like protein [Neisseria weaveri]